jgi:hypothetical protein
MGPVGSWDGLEVVQGSKLVTGPLGSVAGEPDRRQHPLLCPFPVQASGTWQVRQCVCSAQLPWQVQATAVRATPRPLLDFSLKFAHFASFSTSFLGERLRKWAEQYFLLRDILFHGNYVTSRWPGSAGRVDPLLQVPKLGLGARNTGVGHGT